LKNNGDLQKDVQDALKWEPLLNAVEIGVTAIDGIITLSGIVNSYSKKMEAEDVAKCVLGLKAVVENIEVDFENTERKNDNEIANEILNACNLHKEIPNSKKK
jgi:hypothetical protein